MSELKRQLMAKSGGYKRRAPRIAPGKTGEEIEEMPSLGQVAGLVFIAIVMAIGIVAGNSGSPDKAFSPEVESAVSSVETANWRAAKRVFESTTGATVEGSPETMEMRVTLPGNLPRYMADYDTRKMAYDVWQKLGMRASVAIYDDTGKRLAIADALSARN